MKKLDIKLPKIGQAYVTEGFIPNTKSRYVIVDIQYNRVIPQYSGVISKTGWSFSEFTWYLTTGALVLDTNYEFYRQLKELK